MKVRGRFFEFLVLDQLPDQIPTWIIFLGVFFRRLLINRQQAPAFQINQVRCHHDEFAGKFDIQFLERLMILEVLTSDEINIYDISLERITRQYLEYLRAFKELNIELAGKYVLMSGYLIYLKSRSLLRIDQEQ